MYVPVEVLALVAVAVVLLVGAILAQRKTEGLLRSQLAAKDRPIQPIVVVDDDAPGPEFHLDHKWAKKHFGERRGFRLYRCTVPHCPAVDCRSGNA